MGIGMFLSLLLSLFLSFFLLIKLMHLKYFFDHDE